LIKVHARLVYSDFKHDFYVIGDGPEKFNLENMIKENNVQNTFHLLGQKENPYPYVKQADYFCLLSNFEGYGMVLEEAKILGKTIIITDTAAREAVEKYTNSVILENSEEKIYEGLKQIIQNHEQNKNKYQENVEHYDNSKIIEKIEQLINK
jgi:glycosyltransferase involved in cell wall biosynthesis